LSTIESHLASFIFTGEVSVKELVDERKVEAILSVVRVLGAGSLGPIKSRLGDGYSFAEIRAVVNYFRYLSKTSLGS